MIDPYSFVQYKVGRRLMAEGFSPEIAGRYASMARERYRKKQYTGKPITLVDEMLELAKKEANPFESREHLPTERPEEDEKEMADFLKELAEKRGLK